MEMIAVINALAFLATSAVIMFCWIEFALNEYKFFRQGEYDQLKPFMHILFLVCFAGVSKLAVWNIENTVALMSM